ncbi:hypothetical protein B484DRAFT_64448 [Ochromonadaceae sp. CCMP2298]|nr:hypothetical protein B484DRAFT_64448 [Ochromonadaceae sp. CCMP2298]
MGRTADVGLEAETEVEVEVEEVSVSRVSVSRVSVSRALEVWEQTQEQGQAQVQLQEQGQGQGQQEKTPPLCEVVRKALFLDSNLEGLTRFSYPTDEQEQDAYGGDAWGGEQEVGVGEGVVYEGYEWGEAGVYEGALVEQEQVTDVLDYLLEMDELDQRSYKRLSSQRFSVASVRRMSMGSVGSRGSRGSVSSRGSVGMGGMGRRGSVGGMDMGSLPLPEGVEEEGEGEVETEGVCSPVPTEGPWDAMGFAVPSLQGEQEECALGEMDVLNALRSYINAMNTHRRDSMSKGKEGDDVEVEEVGGEVKGEVETEVETEGEVETEVEVEVETEGEVETEVEVEVETEVEVEVELEEGACSTSTSDRISLPVTTLRVSFCALPPVPILAGGTSPGEQGEGVQKEGVQVESDRVVQTPRSHLKRQMTFPLGELLEDLMSKGQLRVTLVSKLLDGHVKYIVHTSVAPFDGNGGAVDVDASSRSYRSMSLQPYSAFRGLRVALMAAVEEEQNMGVYAINYNNSGGRDSVDGNGGGRDSSIGIGGSGNSRMSFGTLPDRRGSTDSVMSRDSLDGNVYSVAGVNFDRRASDMVPPLPSRQLLSMGGVGGVGGGYGYGGIGGEGGGGGGNGDGFELARESFLRAWLISVFAKQACRGGGYREQLCKFLTGN